MIRKQSYMDYLSNPTSQLIWISNSCRQTDKLNFFWTINYLETKKKKNGLQLVDYILKLQRREH